MKSINFMAFSKGMVSTDAAEIKRYIGIGVCRVVGFNPTKAQMKELMGYEPNDEPAYYGVQEVNGQNVPFARLSFVMRTIPELSGGIETTQMLTFFLRNQYRKGSQSGKYQVIDEYGRTAWGDEAVVKAKGQIMYSNGPANVTTNYRPIYVGEEELTNFLKNYICIPNPTNYVNGAWIMKSAQELQDCQCRLDNIPNYFKGDFKEITEVVGLQPENKVKVLFGIRSNDNGQEYQDLYTHMVLRSSSNNITALQKDVEDRQANGGLNNRRYEFTPLHEYKVEPTDMSSQPKSDDPFATEDSPW